jgi:SAM-dependent MidA family methyltransferase
MTVAAFVEQALYHESLGYYSTQPQRSGRDGDFYTSVDVGNVFGQLLAAQFEEMWVRLRRPPVFDLVEAAAGNGRLARDVVSFAAVRHPAFYRAVRLHLVERSARARERQRAELGEHAGRLAHSDGCLPDRMSGVLYANELLDAMPPHLVVMRNDGLREVYIDVRRPDRLVTAEGPLSTPRVAEYLARVGAQLQPGWHAEVNLAAFDWVRDAGARLDSGFLVLVDYGHEAARLYSAAYATGTLTTYRRHASEGREDGPGWLMEPGARDITSHVDLTGIALAAADAGLRHDGTVDQTRFLLGLGQAEGMFEDGGSDPAEISRRLALKTLLLPGGLGSTHKVMVFSKAVEPGPLRGLPAGRRVT